MSAEVDTSPKPRASTSDILGDRNGHIKPRWRRHYLRLVELRQSLEMRQSRLAEAAKEEQPNFSSHIGDAGTDQFNQDLALSVLSSDQSAIYEIDQALDRIHDGSYGICELTGEPIEPERLEAIPWTRFSLYAQELLERDGGLPRIQFGPRRTLADVSAQDASEPADNDSED